MRLKTIAACLALSLVAVGCAGGEKPPVAAEGEAAEEAKPEKRQRVSRDAENAGPCPTIGVLNDASRVVEFAEGQERYASVAWTAEFWGVRGLCRYIGDDPIVMNLEATFGAGRGPAARGDRHTYRYWVAVTRRDRLPLAKQYFEVTVDFDGADRERVTHVVERIVIPRANGNVSGANFEVLVGFDLNDQQLAYNRAGKRFRVDVGQTSN